MKKVFLGLSYIFYTLIILEIVLFFSARVLTLPRINDFIEKDRKTIITIGDSYTYGAHVQNNQTYPYYLSEYLNRETHSKGYNVVNLGLSGSNTNYIKKNIEKYIDLYQPEYFLILTGANNYSNFDGFKSADSLLEKIKSFIIKRRIFRLYMYLFGGKSENINNEVLSVDRIEQEDRLFDFSYIDFQKYDIESAVLLELLEKIPQPDFLFEKFKNSSEKTSILNFRKLDFTTPEFKLLYDYRFSEADRILSECVSCSPDSLTLLIINKIMQFKEYEALDIINSFYDEWMMNDSIVVLKNIILFRTESDIDLIIKRIIDEINIVKNPDLSLFLRLSLIFEKYGKMEQSLKWLEAAVKLFPEDGMAWLELGRYYFENNNLTEAVRSFNKGIEVQPDYVDNYLFLAETQAAMGNLELFRENYDKGRKMAPEYNEVYFSEAFTLNQYFFNEKNKQEILELILKGITKNPGLFKFYNKISEEQFNNICLVLETLYFIDEIDLIHNYTENMYEFLTKEQKLSLVLKIPVLINNPLFENFKLQFVNFESHLKNNIVEFIRFIDFIIADWNLKKALEFALEFEKSLSENLKYLSYPVIAKISMLNGDYSKAVDYLIKYRSFISEDKIPIIDEAIQRYAVVARRYDVFEREEKMGGVLSFVTGKEFHHSINEWIINDIKRIVEICNKKNIVPVFMNYFENDMKIIRDFCNENNINFIDNYNFFQNYKLNNPEENFDKYFVPDRHLSEKGNMLKAEYIYKELLKIIK